jgi:hypothetical protein
MIVFFGYLSVIIAILYKKNKKWIGTNLLY